MTIPVSRSGIRKELRELGLSISLNTLKNLENLGLYKLQKVAWGKRGFRSVTSRKEAEKIKRLLWVYYYGKEPYPDDINDGE